MKVITCSACCLWAVLSIFPMGLSAQVDTLWMGRWTSGGAESDWAYAVAVDDSGNTYVTGKTENSGTGDDWTTIKYLPDGDTAWVRNLASAGSANERASCICIGPFGNIYITGYTMSTNAGDYLTVKYRPDGDTAWTRRYNGSGNGYDFAHWITVDADENVYVTGYSRGASYQDDIATVAYDSSGNQLWTARYNGMGSYNDKGYKVIVDNAGHVYVVGYANPNASGTLYDYAVLKYDAGTGDTLWARTYNGPADSADIARDIAVDAAGYVYVTGSSRGAGTQGDIYTIAYDPSGGIAWTARYDNPDTSLGDAGYGVRVDQYRNCYVVGQSQGRSSGSDIVLIKYDTTGAEQWVSRYNGPANDYDTPSDEVGGKCLAMDQAGNLYITGASRGATSNNDFVTLMYAPDSVLLWSVTYNCCDSVDHGLAIAVDTAGGVCVCGRSVGLGTYYDMAAVKYQTLVGTVERDDMPTRCAALSISPNPFRTTTILSYALPGEDGVAIVIYDASGRRIRTLLDRCETAGNHSVVWDGTDDRGKPVSPGVYFCLLSSVAQAARTKIVMTR